jgi:hypothetical protein
MDLRKDLNLIKTERRDDRRINDRLIDHSLMAKSKVGANEYSMSSFGVFGVISLLSFLTLKQSNKGFDYSNYSKLITF